MISDPLPFGVPALESSLGPVARGGTLLVESSPEVEAMPWLLQAADAHLQAGRSVVFLCTARAPQRVVAAMKKFGFTTDGLTFVDAFSRLNSIDPGEGIVVDAPNNLSSIVAALTRIAQENEDSILLIDALDSLFARIGEHQFTADDAWSDALRKFRLTAAAATAWEGPIGRPPGFDAIVALRGVEDRVVLNQVFRVEQTPWSTGSARASLYKVNRPGGILAYIPKIVVVGPHDAGKTTFVHSVSDQATSVERLGTTVALDRGTFVRDGVQVDVYGTPGQTRFDALLPTLTKQASGAILVVDATRPDTFERAGTMLRRIWQHGLSAAVALNKQDEPNAATPEQARAALALPDGVPIMPCIATESENARNVVTSVVHRLLEGAA